MRPRCLHRLVGDRDGKNPARQRDFLAAETARVADAAKPFVCGEHEGCRFGKLRMTLEEVVCDERVLTHQRALLGREVQETKIDDDHRLTNDIYKVLKMVDGKITLVDEPALTALNMRLRDDYTEDCAKGVERWNKVIEKAGVNFRLELPHTAFHRQIGEFANVQATPKGIIISDAEWEKIRNDHLPSKADGDFIESLMQPVSEPGRFANWIAPPKVGIDNKPGDFEYVKIAA